jgi:hypothetical protein
MLRRLRKRGKLPFSVFGAGSMFRDINIASHKSFCGNALRSANQS